MAALLIERTFRDRRIFWGRCQTGFILVPPSNGLCALRI
jgi:hypothetical protein